MSVFARCALEKGRAVTIYMARDNLNSASPVNADQIPSNDSNLRRN
jgi:hypothetical protein